TIASMIASAQKGFLTLLGITPEYPETGYGYIEKGASLKGLDFTYNVDSFREKPDAALAASYIETERFLWNSGIFAWQVSTILNELRTYVPSSIEILSQALGSKNSFTELAFDQFSAAYNSLQSIAIDPAVLEKSDKVTVVEADIGWKDVGSWDALSQCFSTDDNGNLFYGDVISIDSSGMTVDSDAKMVACIGVKDLVVVCSEGAVLVCPRERAQDVKYIVEQLKKRGSIELY
ncbi:MAG: mannose-1-phosphate guanylyltransferase/mannose-6-phosphate isomerase, partial [Proteobacteria bacterium]